MTNETAKRAVACKGWRWMPGMLLAGHSTPWRLSLVSYDVLRNGPPYGGWLPCLDDFATLGCLRALVREAWDDWSLNPAKLTAGPWVVDIETTDGGAIRLEAEDEAGVLVAALEAADAR